MSDDKNMEKAVETEKKELDISQLDQVNGGSIGNAKKEKTQDIDNSTADKF